MYTEKFLQRQLDLAQLALSQHYSDIKIARNKHC